MKGPESGRLLEPRLITFDFGDTLVSSEPTYLARTTQGLGELGYAYTVEEVHRAYFEADIKAAEVLLPRGRFSPEEFREIFGSYFFHGLKLADQAHEVGPKLLAKLIEHRPRRVMVEGARQLLEKLHQMGYPLAIISNNDGFTQAKCEAVGIADYFMFILDSTQEGIMKPDPRIFRRAIQQVGVSPEQTLHVGDLWGCDIMGAKAVGISAVWLGNDLVSPQPRAGVARIDRLLDLLELVKP